MVLFSIVARARDVALVLAYVLLWLEVLLYMTH